jgi:hypothetical protein
MNAFAELGKRPHVLALGGRDSASAMRRSSRSDSRLPESARPASGSTPKVSSTWPAATLMVPRKLRRTRKPRLTEAIVFLPV